MEISVSIFGLAKNNNGFFKSEKQAKFLISQMEKMSTCIGHVSSGFNSCPVFATWDEKGITALVKSTKNGDVVMFERKLDGVLTSIEAKEMKRISKRIKDLEREINERQDRFNSGQYNGSGDINTYTPEEIKRFNSFQESKLENLEYLKNTLRDFEKQK